MHICCATISFTVSVSTLIAKWNREAGYIWKLKYFLHSIKNHNWAENKMFAAEKKLWFIAIYHITLSFLCLWSINMVLLHRRGRLAAHRFIGPMPKKLIWHMDRGQCLFLPILLIRVNFYSDIWSSYQIRKIARCACDWIPGSFPRSLLQTKPLVMHVGIAKTRWRGNCSRHFRRMRKPQFYVSVKRPIAT